MAVNLMQLSLHKGFHKDQFLALYYLLYIPHPWEISVNGTILLFIAMQMTSRFI